MRLPDVCRPGRVWSKLRAARSLGRIQGLVKYQPSPTNELFWRMAFCKAYSGCNNVLDGRKPNCGVQLINKIEELLLEGIPVSSASVVCAVL